jgi:hypothetical protein
LSGEFGALTRKLNDCKDEEERSEYLNILFDITKEIHLRSAIRDIRDELNILDHILGDQHKALLKLGDLCASKIHKETLCGPTDLNRKEVQKMKKDAEPVYMDVRPSSITEVSADIVGRSSFGS